MVMSPSYSPFDEEASSSCTSVFQANMLADANMWSGKDLGGPQEKTRSVASDSDTEAPSENAVPGEELLSESETEEGTMAPAGIIGSDAAKDAHVDNTMEVPLWVSEPFATDHGATLTTERRR